MAHDESLHIDVVYCPRPGRSDQVALQLAPGATVGDALAASGVVQRHGLDPAAMRLGVWCRAAETAGLLRDHDRVEVYRPLQVDPKEARRLRYKRHRDSAG